MKSTEISKPYESLHGEEKDTAHALLYGRFKILCAIKRFDGVALYLLVAII